jgi:hypothetical protein
MYWGNGGIVPSILDLEVSGQLHAPVALSPGKEPPDTRWIEGWFIPRTGVDTLAKRKIPGFELQLSIP